MSSEKFVQVMTDLLFRRELAGGFLSQEEESETATVLQVYWEEMTEAEQEEAEKLFNQTPKAPEDLGLVDVAVEIGSTTFPRKNADRTK